MGALKKVKVPALEGSGVTVYFSPEWEEYVVKVRGKPQADYHTSDKTDAFATAQRMRNSLLIM